MKFSFTVTLSWVLIGCCVAGLLLTQQPILILLGCFTIALALASLITPLVIVAMLVILSPLRALVLTEAPELLPFDIGQTLFAAVVLVSVVQWLVQRKTHFLFAPLPLLLSLGGFLLATGLSGFEASSQSFWLSEWFKWVSIFILVHIVINLCQQRIIWLIRILVIAGVSNALVGLYIFLGGSGADHLLILDRFFRAFGTFGQPNPFGGFMGLLLPIAIALSVGDIFVTFQVWRRGELSVRQVGLLVLSICATAIIALALVLSWSRGAWLGFFVSFVVMAFAFPKKLWRSFSLAFSVLLMIGVLWVTGLVPSSISQRIIEVADQYLAFSDVRGLDISTVNYAGIERIAHWQAAVNMVTDKPWIGVGFGNYEIAYNQYRLLNWKEALGHAHNYYLNILAETGMIGLTTYLALWITVVVMTWRTRIFPDVRIRFVVIGLLGSWTYLSVHSLIDNLYVNNLFLHIGLLLGILSILYRQAYEYVQWGKF